MSEINGIENRGRGTVYERVRAGYARSRAETVGGLVFRERYLELFACPFIDRFNGLLSPDWPEEKIGETWRRAVSVFRESGQGMFVSFGPSSGKRLREWVERIGAVRSVVYPGMVIEPGEIREIPGRAGLRIERIEDFRFFAVQEHPWLGVAGTEFRDLKLQFLRKYGEGERPKLWQFVAFLNRRLAGFATVFVEGDEAAVFDLVVPREYRRLGIGSRLMFEIGVAAAGEGIGFLGLAAEGAAGIALYEKLGFRREGGYEDFYFSAAEVSRMAEEGREEISLLRP